LERLDFVYMMIIWIVNIYIFSYIRSYTLITGQNLGQFICIKFIKMPSGILAFWFGAHFNLALYDKHKSFICFCANMLMSFSSTNVYICIDERSCIPLCKIAVYITAVHWMISCCMIFSLTTWPQHFIIHVHR